MMTIWKFPLRIDDEQEIELPPESTLLSVHLQNGQPCLWALVEDRDRTSRRIIQMRGTGHNCEDAGEFVGTFLIENDGLVFHVFDGGLPA